MAKKSKNLSAVKRKNFVKNNAVFLGVLGVLILLGAFVFLGASQEEETLVYGDDVVEMHFFHLSTCPHCHRQIAFQESFLLEKYPTLKINEYEITRQASKDLYLDFASRPEYEGKVDPTRISTPTTFIGSEVSVGYGDDTTTGALLDEMIQKRIAEIEENWDEATMVRTADLRAQLANQ